MTVESSNNKSGPFIASGATGVFPRTFLVFDPAHVRVVRSRDGVETDITTGISHSGMGSASGTVTLSQGIQAGDRITLLRNVPNVQRSKYSAQSSVPTDQVELDFDLLAMQMQDLAERQDRTLTLPVDSTQSGEEAMRAALAAPRYALEAKESALAAQAAAKIIVNVKQFGAVGDGVANDSPAFQLAVDNVGDGIVIVPPGRYRVEGIQVSKGCLVECQSGSSEVTANASGTTSTAVTFIYSGGGGPGSRIFTFKSAAANQWIKGGGITGRPHLTGNNLCELLIDAQSMHGAQFDVEMSRATFAGMSLNAGNGVLSQFCDVDFKYIWGAQAATETSHGLILNGNHPDGVNFAGCTQHRIWSNGAVKHGDMVRMVGHCDNNHLWIHATQGLGMNRGSGYSLAIRQGNGGLAARINHIHYLCGRLFRQVNSFGNTFDFVTSEGASIDGGGQDIHRHLVEYTTGKAFASKVAPLTEYRFVSAAELMPTGAAVKELAAGASVPIIRLPKSGAGGAAFCLHDPVWGAGTIAALEWIYRGTGSGNTLMEAVITASRETEGIAPDLTATETLAVNGGNVQRHARITAVPVLGRGIVAVHTQRLPSNGLDTLASDLHLIGLRVRIDFNGPTSLEAPVPAWKEEV